MWDRWDGKSMWLNGRPLVGCTANKARDPFLLHLTLYSLLEGIILWGMSAGVGEANDELTPGNIAIVLMARRSCINKSSFRYGHCECRGGRGLMDLKEFSFSFKMVVRWVKNVRWQMLFVLEMKVQNDNIAGLADDKGSCADKKGCSADKKGFCGQ